MYLDLLLKENVCSWTWVTGGVWRVERESEWLRTESVSKEYDLIVTKLLVDPNITNTISDKPLIDKVKVGAKRVVNNLNKGKAKEVTSKLKTQGERLQTLKEEDVETSLKAELLTFYH